MAARRELHEHLLEALIGSMPVVIGAAVVGVDRTYAFVVLAACMLRAVVGYWERDEHAELWSKKTGRGKRTRFDAQPRTGAVPAQSEPA